MKKNYKRILGLASLACLMFLATGCGSESKAEDKELVFWSVFTGPDGENMNNLVAEYNATNPEYTIKHVPIEQNDMYTRIPTVVGSGKDVPDLTIMHAERIANFVDQGVIMNLDEYISANGEISSDNYVPQAWDIGTVDGSQYGIPLDVHSFVTYYNEDLVNQYAPVILDDGVITFEEMVDASAKAQNDGIAGLGITWMRPQYLSFLAQLGGDLSEDGTTPNLNTPEGAKVFEELTTLVETKVATQDGDDPGQLFRSGQLMFWPEGIWMINSIKDIPDLNWGMTHMPTLDAENQVNWTSSHQFTMLDNEEMSPERAEGVMDFVNWVGENSLEWATAGQVPAQLSITENEEFNSMPQSFLLDDTSKLKIYDYKDYGYAVEALDKVVYEVIFGRMSTEDALAQMQKEVSEKIEMAN